MALLTAEEKKRIGTAVAEAEKNTGGEIVTALIPESDSYMGRELLVSLGAGILVFILAAFSSANLSRWLEQRFWFESSSLLPFTIGGISLAVGVLVYLLVQIPAVDRMVIGQGAMEVAVQNRAIRHFVESAAYDTIDRTGVLLFVSSLERRVELIADRGINDVVAPDTWDRIVSSLIRGIKEGNTAESLEKAVQEIGIVLAEHVPPRPDDTNELSDGPVELGRGT